MITGALLVQALISGLLMGGIYALVALALALSFGVLRVLNFAHGDLLMVAMYGAVVLHRWLGLHPYWAIVVLALPMLALGWLMFVGLIRPVQHAGVLVQAQMTLGVSFALQSAALMIFGADLLNIRTEIETAVLRIGGVVVSVPLAIGFAVSLSISAALSWVLLGTDAGRRVRATAQDPDMARLCGVDVERTQRWVFALSIALLAGVAGCLMSFSHVVPTAGLQYSVLALLVVMLGGLGDLKGAFVGGLLIGVAEALAGVFLSSAVGPAVIYVLFGLTLLFRPQGLFGRGMEA